MNAPGSEQADRRLSGREPCGDQLTILRSNRARWLHMSRPQASENSAANAVVFCVVLVAIAEAWVPASRWYPRLFGLSEMSIAVGYGLLRFPRYI
jgi:hypothetical protein